MHQIIPDLYNFSGMILGRVYLIKDPDGLTIVDTALSFSVPRIVRQLREAGYKPRDVKRILITHGHPDHAGGLPKLKRITRAQVVASTIDCPVIEGRRPIPVSTPLARLQRLLPIPRMKLKGTKVDRTVTDGDTIPEVMGGLQVIATPGHTMGHVSFWQPERRMLFCGDVMINVGELILPAAPFTVDMEENKRSVRRLAALDTQTLCCGHGTPIAGDAAGAIKAFADKLSEA